MAAKALVTKYNGYNFRSRLAARWAVFFDTVGIDYVYESQQYDLADGLTYVPDFYLQRGIRFLGEEKPRQDVWVTVLRDVDLPDDVREQVVGFVQETGKNVLLMGGAPGLEAEVLFIGRSDKNELDAAMVAFIELAGGQTGLVAERELAKLEREEDQALVEQRKHTELLEEAYRIGRETEFDRRMKRCHECGNDFQPKNFYDTLCYRCFTRQRANRRGGKEAAGRVRRPTSSIDLLGMLQSVTPAQRRVALTVFGVVVFGLLAWSACQVVTIPGSVFAFLETEVGPTATPPLPATYTPVPTQEVNMEGLVPGIVVTRDVCSCAADLYECTDFATWDDAQACFDFCRAASGDVHLLDEDGDGFVCLDLIDLSE